MTPAGQIYSLNDARQNDWPAGLQTYIGNIRQGKGQTGKQYSARYVCSLVADFHRQVIFFLTAYEGMQHAAPPWSSRLLETALRLCGLQDAALRWLGSQPQVHITRHAPHLVAVCTNKVPCAITCIQFSFRNTIPQS